jgi:hypothetical protein
LTGGGGRLLGDDLLAEQQNVTGGTQSTSHLLFSDNLRVVLVNWNLLRCCEAYLSPRGAHKDTTTSRHELCQMGFQIWRACGVDIPGALLPFAK